MALTVLTSSGAWHVGFRWKGQWKEAADVEESEASGEGRVCGWMVCEGTELR